MGATLGCSYRLLSVDGREDYRALIDLEKRIYRENGSPGEKLDAFENGLESILQQGFSDNATLVPVGQGLAFAQWFAEQGKGMADVLDAYHQAVHDSVCRVKNSFPFSSGSALASHHRVEFPIVQGPMARVTGDPRLAVEVAKAGGLPFVAGGGLSPGEIRRLLTETRRELGNYPFGLGLIGFSPSDDIDKQIQAVLCCPPDFLTLAGGDPGIARILEESGIRVYMHAPSLSHVKILLDSGVRGVILEGHEAGGHVGALGSMVLWELGVHEVMERDKETASGVKILLAGGLANARGALVAAVLASPAVDCGIALGLQIGTAYLLTEEAVECGAVPRAFQRMLHSGNITMVLGRTVNLAARWLATRSAREMWTTELELEEQGLSLAERKRLVERMNHASLAASLIADGPEPENTEISGAYSQKAYLCGQMIGIRPSARRIRHLHADYPGYRCGHWYGVHLSRCKQSRGILEQHHSPC